MTARTHWDDSDQAYQEFMAATKPRGWDDQNTVGDAAAVDSPNQVRDALQRGAEICAGEAPRYRQDVQHLAWSLRQVARRLDEAAENTPRRPTPPDLYDRM